MTHSSPNYHDQILDTLDSKLESGVFLESFFQN